MKRIIGLDLGQANDFTAIVLLEQHENELHVTHLERHIKKPYTQIAAHVIALFRALEAKGPCELVLDLTGVGRGVADMLAEVKPVRVSIHGGQTVTNSDMQYNVPKRDLIAALVVEFEGQTIKIASSLELGAVLAQEALNLKAKITQTGHTELAADWRTNEHDDLALALACAVWWARWSVKNVEYVEIPVFDMVIPRVNPWRNR